MILNTTNDLVIFFKLLEVFFDKQPRDKIVYLAATLTSRSNNRVSTKQKYK